MQPRFLAFTTLATLATLATTSFQAQADTVALWDYTAGTTKQTQSANGASFAALGAITISPTAAGVSGNALSTTTYAAQSTGDLSRGVQYYIDTSGYTNLLLTFAQRNSATASAWTALLYTLDGSTWTAATNFQMPASASTTFVGGISYNFASILGANDNANFGIELLATYAPGTSAYTATGSGSSYGTAGTIRYDNVLLSGTPIAEAVPEPETYALMLAGLGLLGLVARRRAR